MILRARDLAVRYPRAAGPAVTGAALDLDAGELVAVVGPNGSGKTTLLRALLGTLPLAAGSVALLDRPLGEWTSAALARVVGVVTQREESLFPLTVEETVSLGRYAFLGPLAPLAETDRRIVAEAMATADVAQLAARPTDQLSGGEWQRVRIARALAQQPRLLVLDEPTASLDIRHEMEVFELVRRLAGQGIASLVVSHQLNLAARYADRLLLLHEGRVVADGPPATVLTRETVAHVFDWPVAITSWCDGAPQVVPLKPGE
ncbi:MAG: ABC transporter ATP-binding protein [Gemmatimonadales bacterium]|nr:ABC transporter ATP-binding protein [Gemmatimonadales bacterium]